MNFDETSVVPKHFPRPADEIEDACAIATACRRPKFRSSRLTPRPRAQEFTV